MNFVQLNKLKYNHAALVWKRKPILGLRQAQMNPRNFGALCCVRCRLQVVLLCLNRKIETTLGNWIVAVENRPPKPKFDYSRIGISSSKIRTFLNWKLDVPFGNWTFRVLFVEIRNSGKSDFGWWKARKIELATRFNHVTRQLKIHDLATYSNS